MNDADFLAWMDRESIHKIARWPARRVSVELMDGSFGVARTVTDALAKARTGHDSIARVA